MQEKKRKTFIIIGIIVLIALSIYLYTNVYTSSYNQEDILPISCLNYSSEDNYAQSGMTCGPFSVAGTVRAITQEETDSWEFVENINFKIGDKGTHPWGLKGELIKNDIKIEVPQLKAYTNEERIEFLQERLSQNKAIILLGEPEGIKYEHYLTVLGFDKENDIFYIYDSLEHRINSTHTIDSNGDLPGNKNWTSEELLSFWEKGGMYGFYEWFAIVGSEKE